MKREPTNSPHPSPPSPRPARSFAPCAYSRGLTLIELLAALVLLGALAVAVSGWAVSSMRAGAQLSDRVCWERAAAAVLDLIAHDLRTGDFTTPTTPTSPTPPTTPTAPTASTSSAMIPGMPFGPDGERIRIEDGVLAITTRAADPSGGDAPKGRAVHTYRLDQDTLFRDGSPPTPTSSASPPSRTRPLLGNVLAIEARIDEEPDGLILTVTITNHDRLVTRRYRLP